MSESGTNENIKSSFVRPVPSPLDQGVPPHIRECSGLFVSFHTDEHLWNCQDLYVHFQEMCRQFNQKSLGEFNGTEWDQIVMHLRQLQSITHYTELGFTKMKMPKNIFNG